MLKVLNCENEKGKYYTIINTTNSAHAHALNKKDLLKIQNCFNLIANGRYCNKYPRYIRIKAFRLYSGIDYNSK